MKRILFLLLLSLSFFAKAQLINKAEYFIDTDPGNGNGINIPVTADANSTTFSATIATASLTPGFHNLFTRARLADGVWSLAESRTFLLSVLDAATVDIVAAEYFIDTDPGQGNATAVNVGTTGSSVSFVSVVPTVGLSGGFHSLFMRAKNSAGVWSLVESRVLLISVLDAATVDIVAAEYFIDTDPGQGNAVSVSVGTTGNTVTFASVVPTLGLSGGFHNLFMRAKNSAGVWSLVESRVLLISILDSQANDIVAAEYFIDTDPGSGSGTAVSVGTVGGSVNFTTSIVTTGLSNGFHNLHLRAKNSSGIWSLSEKRIFFISDQFASAADVSAAEYFIDTDPGLGNGTAINIGIAGSTATFIAAVPTTGLAVGKHFLFIRAKSADGWGQFEQQEFTVGAAVAPGKPTITTIAGKTSPVVTNLNKPPFIGKAEANSTVEVFSGATSIGTIVTNASGDWSPFIPAASIADGTYNITITAKNASNLTSVASDVFILTVDTQNPIAPVISSIDGKTAQGFSTNSAKPIILGIAEALATVELFNGATSLGTTTATAGGTYSFTPLVSLPDGNYLITAKAKDVAGNLSLASATFSFNINNVAPAAPQIVNINGFIVQNFVTANNKPTITGNASPNSVVEIFNGPISLGFVTADVTGKFTFTPLLALADGSITITTRAKDSAGNVSPISTSFIFIVDTALPNAPLITSIDGKTTPGFSTNATKPIVNGTAEALSTVELFNGTTSLGTTGTNAAGAYSFTPSSALPDGNYVITSKAKDAAGNVSIASNAFNFRIDNVAPSAPFITTVNNSAIQNQTIIINKPVITGTGEANSTVEIFNGTTSLGVITVDATGKYTFTPTSVLPEGTVILTARSKDAAGNISISSVSFTVIVDTVPPNAPIIVNVDGKTVQGFTITKRNPIVLGTAEALSTVELFNGTTNLGTNTASVTGTYSFNLSALPDGNYVLTAKAKDAAGNLSSASNAFSFTIDNVAPVVPAIVSVEGKTAQNFATANNKPSITGTTEPNAIIEIFNGAISLGFVTADANGKYTFTPTSALPEGTVNLSAKAKDVAGNVSLLSSVFSFTIDSQAPIAPVIASVDGKTTPGFTTNVSRPIVIGTAENNVGLEFFNGPLSLGVTIANATGSYTFISNVDLPVGSYVLTAKAKDGAGNLSASSNAFAFTIAPANPQVSANNILTPNNDGINDFLTVTNLQFYPTNKLLIYDRAGRIIYTVQNYKNDWDGRVNGGLLAEGTYYYNLDLGAGLKSFKSFVTVIRKNNR